MLDGEIFLAIHRAGRAETRLRPAAAGSRPRSMVA